MVVLGTVRSLFAYCMVHGAWCKLHAASKIGWKSGGFGYSMKFVCVLCMMRTAYCLLHSVYDTYCMQSAKFEGKVVVLGTLQSLFVYCMVHTACSKQN